MPFYVNNEQSALIIALLKKNPLMPEQQLNELIVESCRVESDLAEAFIKSWRWNHDTEGNIVNYKQGGTNAITTIHAAVKRGGFDVEAAVRGSNVPRVTVQSTAPVPNVSGGKIQQILAMHDAGNSNDEIIAAGFNKSTVYRQVKEYRERKKLAKA